MVSESYDVVVVGAGFAGLTAARELSRGGRRVLVLEARERIGGRTWLDSRMGLDLELGGTWVHWTQPHVWSELKRYGIGLAPSPSAEAAVWWDGSQVVSGHPDELLEALDRPNVLLMARSREIFPEPFAPLTSVAATAIDRLTVKDQIDALPLTPAERTLLESFWTLNFNGRLDDAGFTQALRWVALTNGDWKVCFEACATFKIAGGTRALATAMRDDSDAEIRLGADVRSVEATDAGVIVSTSDGVEILATHVVLAVPLQTLSRISISPALSRIATAAIERGQVGLGAKVWFTVEGEHPPFVAFGAADWPLNFFQSEYVRDGRTYVIGFGPDGKAIDPEDVDAVQAALARLRPELRVSESVGHSWVDDVYSQETWAMHRTGFLSESLEELQRPHGRIHLAGSDIADGWGGFIDGAIESGLNAARRILSSSGESVSAAASAKDMS